MTVSRRGMGVERPFRLEYGLRAGADDSGSLLQFDNGQISLSFQVRDDKTQLHSIGAARFQARIWYGKLIVDFLRSSAGKGLMGMSWRQSSENTISACTTPTLSAPRPATTSRPTRTGCISARHTTAGCCFRMSRMIEKQRRKGA